MHKITEIRTIKRVTPARISNTSSSVIFKQLVTTTGLPVTFLADRVFEVTPKTFAKYKNRNVKLPSLLIEHALRFIAMYKLGLELFGSKDEFNTWLMEKNYGLGYKVPADLLNTSDGIGKIYEELKRIEFGATA